MATGSSAISGLPEGYTVEQSTPQQQATPSGASGLPEGYSLEDSTPTDAQAAYRKATASGPFAPAGAAEKAMGQAIGDNKAQAKEGVHQAINAAGETAAGVLGATVAPAVLESATPVLRHIATEYGQPAIDALKAAAKAHPIVAKLIAHGMESAGLLSLGKYMKVFGAK